MIVSSVKPFNPNSVPSYTAKKQLAKDVQFCGVKDVIGKADAPLKMTRAGFLGLGLVSLASILIGCGGLKPVEQSPVQKALINIFEVLGVGPSSSSSGLMAESKAGLATESSELPSRNLTGGYVPVKGDIVSYTYRDNFYGDTYSLTLDEAKSTSEMQVYQGVYINQIGQGENFERKVTAIANGVRIEDTGVPPVEEVVIGNRVVGSEIRPDGTKIVRYYLQNSGAQNIVDQYGSDGLGTPHKMVYSNVVLAD